MKANIWSNETTTQQRLVAFLTQSGVTCSPSRISELDAYLATGKAELFEGELAFLVLEDLNSVNLNVIRRIRNQTAENAFLVVVAPATDHRVVLAAIRAGANDYVSVSELLEQEVEKLLKCIEKTKLSPAQSGRLVTVASCHCPTDANFLAVNIAGALASCGSPCGLIDFHTRGGELASLLELQPRHTINDLTGRSATIDSAIFRQALTPHKSGIRLLAGPPICGEFRIPHLDELRQIYDLARLHLPKVVINTEDPLRASEFRTMDVSDSLLLVLRMDVVSLHRATLQLKHLLDNGVEPDQIHVVALQTSLPGELSSSVVKRALQVSHFHFLPENRELRLCSVNVGNPVVLEAPRSKMAKAITELSKTVFQTNPSRPQSTGVGLFTSNLRNRLSTFSKRLGTGGDLSDHRLHGANI